MLMFNPDFSGIPDRSILLPEAAFQTVPTAFGIPRANFEETLERNAAETGGARKAAQLLLEQSPAIIYYISVQAQAEAGKDNIAPDDLVGFNDHGGGTESNHRLLVRGQIDGQPADFTLYSPPSDGQPNTEFRHADFASLVYPPAGLAQGLPNELKSAATRKEGGRPYHYLIGDPDARAHFIQHLLDAGFSFNREPYPMEMLFDNTVYTGPKVAWPKEHFQPQIDQLNGSH